MVIIMRYCPECGANVEGLVFRCDCCGANLSVTNPFFIQHTIVMNESGDLCNYVNKIFEILNASDLKEAYSPLSCAVFDIYCLPDNIMREHKTHSKHYVSIKRKKAILTRFICLEDFIQMDREQKITAVSKLIKEELLWLLHDLNKENVEFYQIKIDNMLNFPIGLV